MTFENALKKITTAFATVDATKLADMAVQVTLSDEDCGGTFYFKAESGKLVVEGYDYRDNDAVIDIARKSLMDILAGKSTLDKAIEKGMATAKGNFEKLATLKAAIPEYKAPAKKAAPKKTTKKSTVAAKTEKAAKKVEVKKPVAKAEAPAKKAVEKKETVKKTSKK